MSTFTKYFFLNSNFFLINQEWNLALIDALNTLFHERRRFHVRIASVRKLGCNNVLEQKTMNFGSLHQTKIDKNSLVLAQ